MMTPVKIIAENINDDALKKYYYEYVSRDSSKDDSDSCEICNLPNLFHIDNRGELVIAAVIYIQHQNMWKYGKYLDKKLGL